MFHLLLIIHLEVRLSPSLQLSFITKIRSARSCFPSLPMTLMSFCILSRDEGSLSWMHKILEVLKTEGEMVEVFKTMLVPAAG